MAVKKFNLHEFRSAKVSKTKELVQEVDFIYKKIGFLFLNGHGVPKDVVTE